jgi:hypothetical protein
MNPSRSFLPFMDTVFIAFFIFSACADYQHKEWIGMIISLLLIPVFIGLLLSREGEKIRKLRDAKKFISSSGDGF